MLTDTLPDRLTGGQLPVLVLSATHGIQHFFGRIFPPLIPLLATDLTLPLWKLGMVVSLWGLANGLSQAPIGQLSDRYDRRFLLPAGVLLVGLGYLIVAAATAFGGSLPILTVLGVDWTGSLLVIALGMVVAGIGKAATHPTGYPLISANVGDGEKGSALGKWGSASKIGDAAGPAFVGLVILVLPWQQVFAVAAAIAVLYAVFLFLYMTRSALETVPGQQDGTEIDDGEDGYWVPVMLVLASMIAGGFAAKGIGTYLPTFITDIYAFSFDILGFTVGPESVASMYLSALLLAGAIVILVVGDVVDRYDPWDIMIGLYGLAALAVALLAFAPLNPVTLLIVTMLIGGSLFATNPARDAIISNVAPDKREGRVFGYFWTVLLLTSSTFPVFIGYLGDVVGIRQSFTYLAAGPLLGIVPLLVLRSRRT